MPVYFDAAATTRVDSRVAADILRCMTEDFGNSGSRSHEWGSQAKRLVQSSRSTIARLVAAEPDEVIFTSGATESNNIALLGLLRHALQSGRTHIVSSATEHKAVLEPLRYLETEGLEVELLQPGPSGRFAATDILEKLRPTTLLVSLMQVNNETGVIQPIAEIAGALKHTDTLFHVDAAQSFCKVGTADLNEVDMISVSGHKIAGPKGIGALIARRRGWNRPPLEALQFGGGQERGLRPGTLPVPLIVGLARAAELLTVEHSQWVSAVTNTRSRLLQTFRNLDAQLNSDVDYCAPNILNVALPGINSEALIVALQGSLGIATGSACTSSSYKPSHVLEAMGFSRDRISQSVRFSWWSDINDDDCTVLDASLRRIVRRSLG